MGTPVITAEARGVCALLNETCCFYVNTSSQVEENLLVLKKNIKIIEDLKERAGQGPSWLSTLLSSMETQIWTWLLPLLGPLVLTAFVLLLGPCIIKLLVRLISERIQAVRFQMVLRGSYQPIQPDPESKIYMGPLDGHHSSLPPS